MFIFVLVLPNMILVMTIGVQAMVNSNCTNFKNEPVSNGQRYSPFSYDPCTFCTCQNGQAESCKAILCAPPKDCLNFQLADNKCCEFMCQKGVDFERPPTFNITTIGTKENDGLNTANLGLRLVASTVTSFLVLALLLFMIHRLRQRRLLLMLRRLNNHLSSVDTPTNHRYSREDGNTVGYYRERDHVDFGFFEDPPPPYTFWKPPESYFPQGEAPPPYEAVSTYLPALPLTPHLSTPASGLPLQLPSLSSVSLHANNFQMNDLGQETVRTEENNATLPLHHMNVVGSMSSSSSQSEINLNEGGPAGNDSAGMVCANVKYEDNTAYDAKKESERHVSNLAMFNEYLHEDFNAERPKRRSYSDVLDSLHHCSKDKLSLDCKRRSLQLSMIADRKQKGHLTPGHCHDGTMWLGDVSESSSSSSLTCDERWTDSPSSSDMSSFDYNFLRVKSANSDNRGQHNHESILCQFSESGPSGQKGSSLDKTLSQLKQKMIQKKSAHKIKGKVMDKQEVGTSNPKVNSILIRSEPRLIPSLQEATSSREGDANSNNTVAVSRNHSKSESESRNADFTYNVMERQNSSSLDSTTCSSGASFASSLSSPASPRYGADETPSTSSSCSSSTANYYLNVLHQPSQHARSASVCSETGERKYRLRLSLPREAEALRGEPRRTRAHTSPSGSNVVRISLDLWQQNHESYI